MKKTVYDFSTGTTGIVDAAPEPINPPTEAEIIAQYERALDAHLDAVAQEDRWNNRFTFIARAGYPNPWQEKAVAFGIWMDTCNHMAYGLMEDVQAGTAPMPESPEAFIAMLPEFVLP